MFTNGGSKPITARMPWRGGWDVSATAGNTALTRKSGHWQEIDPNGAARDVTLQAVTPQDNGDWFVISNTGEGAEDLTIKDASGATVTTVKPGEVAAVFVDSAGAWQSYEIVRQTLVSQSLVTATLTAGAEAANVIPVTINLTDLTGLVPVSRVQRFVCSLFEATMIEALAAAFTMAETGAGAEISTTGNARLVIETDANGDAIVSVTDVLGASGKTMFLIVEPVPDTGSNTHGFPIMLSITFD